MELLADLNAAQRRAVTHGPGPLLIVAGAGTGKTTVITRRLAWLIDQQKVAADQVLVLTFTDKAAQELEERVDRLLPYGYVDLWVSTFHSFGERILSQHGLEVGLDSGFKVVTPAQAWFLVRGHLDEFQLKYYKPLGSPTRFIRALLQHFSRVKDENVTPENYLAFATTNAATVRKKKDPAAREAAEKIVEVARAFMVYERLLRDRGFLDFGDLITWTWRLFKTRPSLLGQYRQQFKYILVDEFQDTNIAQYQLVKLLAAPGDNLAVCGDDDQSVYKFRGAALSNILEFKADYPKAAEVVLVENYRSHQNILDLAYHFIQHNNPYRLEASLKQETGTALATPISKQLTATRAEPGFIEHLHAPTVQAEAAGVVAKIVVLQEKGSAWSDCAILVRANHQAEAFTAALAAAGVPFQFVASRGLFTRPEIIDLISYLKLLDNYHESAALARVLISQFRIGSFDLARLGQRASRHTTSLFESMQSASTADGFAAKTIDRFRQVERQVRAHTEFAARKPVSQVVYRAVQDLGVLKRLAAEPEALAADKVLNLNKFLQHALEFERTAEEKSLGSFMASLKLSLEVGEDPAPASAIEGPDAVRVMTVHAAKGLEFGHVFIVSLVDKQFPSVGRREEIELHPSLVKEILPPGDIHLQEERRLFYVAMTRARDGLYLTSADDYGGIRAKKPSRFFGELNLEQYLTSPRQPVQLTLETTPPAAKTAPSGETIAALIPDTLSFTQLKAFWTCPYQYRFAHLLNVPGRPKPTFSYGKSIHWALFDLFSRLKQGERLTLDTFKRLFEAAWIGEWYETKTDEQERKRLGWGALERFYRSFGTTFPKTVALEWPFVAKIGEFKIRGVIDRIDELPDGTVEIVDYKTGQPPKKGKVEEPEQLLLYALAVSQVLKRQPSKLTYHFIDAGQPISVSFTQDDLVEVEKLIQETGQDIHTSDFRATPEEWKCKHCDFRDICEFRAA